MSPIKTETSHRPKLRAKAVLLPIFLMLSLGTVRAAPAERLQLRLGLVEVHYHRGDADLARQAAAAVQRACEIISQNLGINFTRSIQVSIACNHQEFQQLCGMREPAWALAAALRRRRAVVVDGSRVTEATANDLRLVIIHETVHLALFTLEEGRADRLPLWFHEGVATWLSGARHLRLNRGTFDIAAAYGKLIPLARLEQAFPEGASEVELAYLESEAFVAHIVTTRSRAALRRILDGYRRGEPFDEAFREALGESRAQVETAWAASLRSRFPWLRTLWHLVPLTLVMALGAIVAFLFVRWRRWRQYRRWKEEEAWAAVLDEEEPSEPEEEPSDEDDGEWP